MPQLARLSLGQAGPLGVAQPDAASLPWCGALDDVPGCPSSTDRQGFADAVRKARIARLPDPGAGPIRDIADAIPRISSAALRLHKAAAAGASSDPLVAAVAAHVATVHHQSPTETQVGLLKRLGDGLRVAGIGSAVVRVVGRAPAEAIDHVTQLALHAIASSRPCALVFPDAVACYRQATNAWLQPACSAVLNWALMLAARLADVAPGGAADGPTVPLLRVVVTALPTLTIHDEIFSACLAAIPVGSCALISDSGLGATTDADDVVGATCAQPGLFPQGTDVASVDHKTPFAIDTVADALAELHTELALQMDTAGDEDDVEDADADPAASNAGRVPVVVTVVPDAASAQVLRNAALARYVAEPMKLALWDGTADLVAGDEGASLLDAPIGIADEVPLIVVAVADDVITRAAAGNLAAFVAQATSDRDPYLAAVVNMAVADAGFVGGGGGGDCAIPATASSITAMRQVGLDIAAALPRSRDPASGARFIVSPPLATTSGGYDTVVETVTVEASGRSWTVAKLAVDARREHVCYGGDDECPSLGFSTVLVPSQCCHREVTVTAEAAIAVCNGAHAVGRAALAAKSHKGRFGVDLEGLLLRDVAVPLPELLGASNPRAGARRAAATIESVGASTFASYVVRAVTLSEAVLEYGEIRAAASGLPVVGASPVGSIISSELGLWATRLFLAGSTTRATATADSLLSTVARVAHDRRRLVTETAMQQPAATAAVPVPTADSITDALGTALNADVRRWADNANAAATEGDDAAKDASSSNDITGALALAAHTATLWAAYPAVDIAVTPTGGVGLVSAISRVLAQETDEDAVVVCTRSQLAVAAPRSRRSFLPPAPKPAESCRGWAPVAPVTLRSAGTVRVVSLDDDVADASYEKKRTVTIDDDAPTSTGPGGNSTAETVGGEVATHAFPPVDAASGHVCSVACDAAFGSALEGHLPAMIIPTDASAPLVVAKTLLRTFLVNVCTLAAGASPAHLIALPLLPESVCAHPVWTALMHPVTPSNATGVGRWVDGVGLKQPVSSARLFDPVGDSGKGLGTADVVAEMTAIEASGPSKNKSHRSEGGSNTGNTGGGTGPSETAGFVGLLPSASERELIDKAARNILKKGRAEAEALLLKQGKAAFGFVRPDHSFHPFYLHTIARIEAAAASAP